MLSSTKVATQQQNTILFTALVVTMKGGAKSHAVIDYHGESNVTQEQNGNREMLTEMMCSRKMSAKIVRLSSLIA